MNKKWKKRGICLALFLSALGMGTAMAETTPFMSVSEVKEGMHGVAHTVVHGTELSSFDVDVLGVLKNKGATGGDLVLIKVSGPVIDETNGIAQGMSGSPVYINGKLLGAIAYGYNQSGGRIGMVTPIEDMVKLWSVEDTSEDTVLPAPSGDLVPLETPLMASGYTGDALNFLSEKMKDFHMTPYAASTAGSDDTAYPLEAGGSVAASLVTGDLKLGAIGTVTYVDGDHIVAFGHPFMNKGNAGYFMQNSYIFTVVPSTYAPFKLGSVGAEVGAITQDRGPGISGISGEVPPFVALHTQVQDEDIKESRNLNVRMIDSENLLPTLTATSVYDAVSDTMTRTGGGTVSFDYTLYPTDMKLKPFTRKNMYWSSTDIAARSVDEIYNVLRILEQNRFKPYDLRQIKVNMSVTEDRKTAQLLDATASPIIVSPGDTIYLRIRLQPYRGDVFYKDMTFVVPEDQPMGDMILEVRGGGEIPLPYLLEQQKYNLTDEILERLRVYKDFDDLYQKLMDEDQNNQIVAEIIDPNVSLIAGKESDGHKAEIQDKKNPEIPSYIKDQQDKNLTQNEEEKAKSRVDTDYVVKGDGQFSIRVMAPADRDAELKKLAASRKKMVAELQKTKPQNTDENNADAADSQKGAETAQLSRFIAM